MSRNERWNTAGEIKRRFRETTDPAAGAGPIVYVDNGRKYSDDSESHVAVIGRTGKGKTQCCVLPAVRNIIEKNESMIVQDPKGEVYRNVRCFIDEHYQVACIDFRCPRKSPTRWNPLSTPYRLFCSGDPDDRDIASSMLSELWSGVYSYGRLADRFWTESAINYAKGLTYGLFEQADRDYIDLDSVAAMMEQSETRVNAGTLLSDFYADLPPDSLAKRNLATYVTGPNETRGSIHSVAASGLEVFSRSKGLMEMLGDDTLNIMDIDVERPFACFIITPDETDVYDGLSGLLISQLTQHLIRVAQERGGKLPIRMNIILEELGSVGKSIPSLPNLMVAGRSRNIRLMLVLQSIAQLVDIYGRSKAETIDSCIGITIGFSTNSWETLTEWAQRCGERRVECGGQIAREPLITASQLAAMPTGTALVMADSRYKFISRLPFYDEMYDNSGWTAPRYPPAASGKERRPFDLGALVWKTPEGPARKDLPEKRQTEDDTDSWDELWDDDLELDGLLSRIDAKLAWREAKRAFSRKKRPQKDKFHVLLFGHNGNTDAVAQVIASVTGMSIERARKRLDGLPLDFVFETKKDAVKFARDINDAGGDAVMDTP